MHANTKGATGTVNNLILNYFLRPRRIQTQMPPAQKTVFYKQIECVRQCFIVIRPGLVAFLKLGKARGTAVVSWRRLVAPGVTEGDGGARIAESRADRTSRDLGLFGAQDEVATRVSSPL